MCISSRRRNGVKAAFRCYKSTLSPPEHSANDAVSMKTPAKSLEYVELAGEEAAKFDVFFHKKDAMIEVNPGAVILPTLFREIGDEIVRMPIYDTDVWMCSFPRTGSTWAQEMVWLVGNDLDYEKAKQLQQIRCPLVELTAIMQDHHKDWHKEAVKSTSVDLVKNIPRPRYVRSHLPWGLLPAEFTNENNTVTPKIVYTARNPKDLCVSFYHYCLLVHDLEGTLEEFCELFLEGRGPMGSVWKHILGFWERRDDPNVLFLKYEDMKKDLPAIIRQTAKFLGKSISEEEVQKLNKHLSFENMKNNKAVNLEPIIEKTRGKEFLENTNLRFIRKGEIGDWKNHFSDEMAERFDKWAEENLKGTGLSFD